MNPDLNLMATTDYRDVGWLTEHTGTLSEPDFSGTSVTWIAAGEPHPHHLNLCVFFRTLPELFLAQRAEYQRAKRTAAPNREAA